MIVTNETRRPERAEVPSDPVPYAYAPTSVTSFVKVLNEISTQEATRTETPRVEDHSATVSESAPNENPAPGDEVTAESGATENGTTESRATEKPQTATGDGGEASESAASDGADEPSEAEAPAQSPEASAESAPEEMPDTAPTATDQRPEADIETVATTQPPTIHPQTASTATEQSEPATSVDTNSTPQANLAHAAASSTGSQTPATPEDTATPEETDADGATPPPAFPKTLNALLAENAVRQREPVAAPPAVRTASAEIAPDLAQDPPPVEEPPPTTAPAPRSAAMELGGVRTDAPAIPRVPLANLPGELAQQIHRMQQEGNRTMRIRLVPENLGELRIEIQGAGDTMRVRMIAATPAARDALESQMGDLRQSLQKQGLSLNQFSVETGQEQREPRQPFEQPRRRQLPDATAPAAPTITEPQPANPASVALHSSALNVFA